MNKMINEKAEQVVDLLLEAGDRMEFLRNKYLPKVKELMTMLMSHRRGKKNDPAAIDAKAEEIFNSIIQADPTTRGEAAGKYSEWMLKQYLTSDEKDLFIEDLMGLKANLETLEKYKARFDIADRDINKHTKESLFKAASAVRAQKHQKLQHELVKDTTVVYSDDGVLVRRPLSYEAAVAVSHEGPNGETNWCTNWPPDRSGPDHFKRYNSGGGWVAIFKFADGWMAQMEVPKEEHSTQAQFKNVADIEINFSEVFDHYKGSHLDEFAKWMSQFTTLTYKAAQARAGTGMTPGNVAPSWAKAMTKHADLDSSVELRSQIARAKDLDQDEYDKLKEKGDVSHLLIRHQGEGFAKGLKDEIMAQPDEPKIIATKVTVGNSLKSREEMEAVVNGDSTYAKVGLAMNPRCPVDLFKRVIADPELASVKAKILGRRPMPS